jgi:hypothetical protein
MPRVVRMMAHVETDLPRADITHVYLHGAANLRRDLTRCARSPTSPPSPQMPDELTGPVLIVGTGLLGTSIGLACAGTASRCCSVTSVPTTCAPPAASAPAPPGDRRRGAAARGRRVPPDHLGDAIAPRSTSTRRRGHRRRQHQVRAARVGRQRHRRRPLRRRPPDGRQRALRPAGRPAPTLFDGRPWAITPHATTDPTATAWSGARRADRRESPLRLDPEEHDRAVARTSHLPHLLPCSSPAGSPTPRGTPGALRPGRPRRHPGGRHDPGCGCRSSRQRRRGARAARPGRDRARRLRRGHRG